MVHNLFRYSGGILFSLAIAAIGLSAKYAQSWLFPWVAPVPTPHADVLFTDTPDSPQRTTDHDGHAIWQIATVSNDPRPAPLDDDAQAASLSLADQVTNAIYSVPPIRFAFTSVEVPVNRLRGHIDAGETVRTQILNADVTESPDIFYESLHDQQDHSAVKDILVFVHGYNVSHEAAVCRAAQIAEDMPFGGLMVAFSWNSQARTDAYLVDEVTAEHSFWNLAELLARLRQEFGPEVRLHVLAHSMGNRVTLRALNALAGSLDPIGNSVSPLSLARMIRSASVSAPDPPIAAGRGLNSGQDAGTGRIGASLIHLDPTELRERFPQWSSWHARLTERPPLANLIMAAPDVDTSEFQTFLHNTQHLVQRRILYASDTDYALEASRQVHGGDYRAGDSRANVRPDGVEIIRVSGVSRIDPLGHSYYGTNTTVLNQLHTFLRPPTDLTQPIGLPQRPAQIAEANSDERTTR